MNINNPMVIPCEEESTILPVPTITISTDRYEDLIKAEIELQIIKDLAKKDKSSYGYNTDTSKMIDTILNIERNKEE